MSTRKQASGNAKGDVKYQRVSPEIRLIIGKEILLENKTTTDIKRKYNISSSTAKRIKNETIDFFTKKRQIPIINQQKRRKNVVAK